MYPELLHLGPFVISSYGFMMVMAFIVTYIFLRAEGKRFGWEPELSQDLVFYAAIGGVIGSKIYYLIENIGRGAGRNLSGLADVFAGIFTLDLQRIAGGIQNFGAGLVFFGGLMGGMLAVTILLKRRQRPWLPMADTVAPALILGYAIGRIGCFLVGDDYGTATTVPWAMTFPNGLPPTTVPVHPTQLYEFLLGLSIFGFLYFLRTRTKFVGQLFSIYLILAGSERFMIELIRTNRHYIFNLTGAQVIGSLMVFLGAFLLYWLPTREVKTES